MLKYFASRYNNFLGLNFKIWRSFMYCTRQITPDLTYIGASDRRLALFENIYPIPHGVSYNSYLLTDEKTVLLDTVDHSVCLQFMENLEHALNGRKLDYLIVNHMEPDHAATIGEIVLRYPEVTIVANAKTIDMINQFFAFNANERSLVVKEGDTLNVGKHTLTFVMAPMVHWPEVMVTYDTTDKILFSADAFGSFGALNGHLFDDEIDFNHQYLDEARRYYTNIVGKYGPSVQALLKKASSLAINMICPLHGLIIRKNIAEFAAKYNLWSSYTPEEKGVMIAYASIYGNTENAINVLANKLSEKGVKNIAVYDVSSTDCSFIVADAFKYDRWVFASPTYNAGIFPKMEYVLHEIKAHNLQNRTVALLQNGSWAPTSGNLMKNILADLKNVNILDNIPTIKSALKENQLQSLEELADCLK